ncbi:MAG: hypothetical protein QXF35_03030 [Candidatus Bilamarchaeaceae archaeon]
MKYKFNLLTTKDLNKLNNTNYKSRCFSIKYPRLSKAIAAGLGLWLMLEGVIMPIGGGVYGKFGKEVYAQTPKKVDPYDELIESLNQIIKENEKISKELKEGTAIPLYLNSKNGKNILTRLEKAGFEVKDGKVLYKGKEVYTLSKDKKGRYYIGDINEFTNEIVVIYNKEQANMAIENIEKEEKNKPTAVAVTPVKEKSQIEKSQIREKTAEEKESINKINKYWSTVLGNWVAYYYQTTNRIKEEIKKEIGYLKAQKSEKKLSKKEIEELNNKINKLEEKLTKIDDDYIKLKKEIEQKKKEGYYTEEDINKLANILLKDSPQLEEFNKLAYPEKLSFLEQHLFYVLHLQSEAINSYLKQVDTPTKDLLYVLDIINKQELEGYSLNNILGIRLLLAAINDRDLERNISNAKEYYDQHKDKGEKYRNIAEIEKTRLEGIKGLIKENELYNKALEITKNTFGENSEFYKNANSKLVGDKKIIAYTLLSICELKNLNDLKKNTQGFRLELAIEHFNKLFIPSMKSEQIKRFEMAGYDMKEDPLLFNPYAALVIANVGIAQIMGGSRYIDLVAYLNRHDQIQDVHAVITYILEKGGIAYPFIYQNPILTNDDVGVTFLTKIIDENNEKFNKYVGGIDQSFYPNLITDNKNRQHNPYIGSPIEIIESYSPNYIKRKIFPQFLTHRNNDRYEVEYKRFNNRQNYPDERKKEDILSLLTPTEQLLAFEAPQSILAPPPTKIPPSTTARFERLYVLPTQFEMKIGESGFYYNGVPSPSAIQKVGEEGAEALIRALVYGLNVKETGDVKNAADNIINELNKWQPKSDEEKKIKDDIITQLQNAKTPEELRAAIIKLQQKELGIDFLSSICSYQWEGNTLRIRNLYGFEVNINMNVTKEEIKKELGEKYINLISIPAGLAGRIGLAYSQIAGTLIEEKLIDFNEKNEPVFEPTGKTKRAIMSEWEVYLNGIYNFLAFKAPAVLGGVGLVQVNVDINLDKQSLERTISDNKFDFDNWLFSSNISVSIDFPFGEGFFIRRLELGYLNPIFITQEGKMQLTENPFGSITFGYKEKLGNIPLEIYVTPTYLINTKELILSSLIRALIPVGKNWGIIPTLGSSYDFRDGRLNANFELPLQWGIFKLGPSVGIEYKGENINFNILIKGEVNF